MVIPEINHFLKTVNGRNSSQQAISAIKSALSAAKKVAVDSQNQEAAKLVWVQETILEAQELYIQAFQEMKRGEFYNGWCSLDRCEIALNQLRPHCDFENTSEYFLPFIYMQVVSFQSLFPYKIFMSPEFLEKEKKCSTCGNKISIRSPCGHVVGEIYKGEMCHRIVTDFEIIGSAMVESPLQKYSVPFLVDPKTGESKDHHNYSVVNYVIKRLPSPFDSWIPHETQKLHPHSNFTGIGRNGKCPCGSEKKYKKCCLPKQGVLMPHFEIEFSFALPKELQTVEFS